MKPVRLELDHLRKTPRPARISWVLLAIALAFAADVGSSYVKTRAELEARSYPAALTYVAWLAHEKTLKNVRLARHEIDRNDARQRVSFTISADWKEVR